VRLTPDEVPWAISLATRRYPPFDPVSSERWLRSILDREDTAVLTNGRAIAVVGWYVSFRYPSKRLGKFVFLISEPGSLHGYRIFRNGVDWLRDQGCEWIDFDGETLTDLTPFARRIGAKQMPPSFRLEC
jgi:hypothetical protein